MADDRDSPYTAPIAFMMFGAILTGLGALGLTGTENDEGGIPEPVAYLLFGVGGVLGTIGIIAIAVLIGTAPLRRR